MLSSSTTIHEQKHTHMYTHINIERAISATIYAPYFRRLGNRMYAW